MIFEQIPYFVNLSEYVRATVVFFIMFFVFRVGLYFLEIMFVKLTSKTKTDLDDIIVAKTGKPLTFISLLISLYFTLSELSLGDDLNMMLYKMLNSLIAISVGYLIFVIVDTSLIRLWKRLAEKTESKIDDALGQLAHEVLRIVLVVIILIMILNIWGIEVGPFIAGLGIAGLAVALALQPTLANIFSGVSIILDKTFGIGDIIKLENGALGEVYRIGLRTTRIKTFDNEMLIVPNSIIANSQIQNFHQPDMTIRVNVDFGVEYGVDPEYVKKFVIEEIEKMDIINKDEEIRVLFTEMGDSSLNFKVMFWVDNISKKWPAHQEAISRIYRRLYKEKIGIPYPQQTVWLREEGKVKGPSPSDSKFKEVRGKYYSAFGHEYVEEEGSSRDEEKSDSKDKK